MEKLQVDESWEFKGKAWETKIKSEEGDRNRKTEKK